MRLIEKYRETGNKDLLRQFYDRSEYVKSYERADPKWKAKFKILVDLMNLQGKERILDVGCAGKLLKSYIPPSKGQYFSADIASKFEPDYICDAESLNGIAPDSFDWIVLSDILEHLPDPAAALRSARKVASKIIVVVPNWYHLERFGRILPRDPDDRHLVMISPKKWIRLFEASGWKVWKTRGFFYVPSVAFYPFRPLIWMDILFRTAPFRVLSKLIDDNFSSLPVINRLGQELIIVAERTDRIEMPS